MSSDADAVRLGVHLIRTHFGQLTAKVAQPLLHRGQLTLPQLARLSTLAPSPANTQLIRASLLLLAQHNLLLLTPPSTPTGEETYSLDLRRVFDLLRVGRVVEYARQTWGEEGAKVIELLAERGKASLPQILAGLAGEGGGQKVLEEKVVEVEEEVEVTDNDESSDEEESSSEDKKKRGKKTTKKRPPKQSTSRSKRRAAASPSSSSASDGSDASSSDESESEDSDSEEDDGKRAGSKRKRSASKSKSKSAKSSSSKKTKRSRRDSPSEEDEPSAKTGKDKKDKERKTKMVTKRVKKTILIPASGMDKKPLTHSVLLSLLRQSFILPSHPSLLLSPAYLLSSTRNAELSLLRGVIGPKDRKEAFERAGVKVGGMRDEWADWRRGLVKKTAKPLKKGKTSTSKVGTKGVGAAGEDEDEIDPTASFYVNYDRFSLLMRNELIVKAATDRFNSTAGHIVSTMLSLACPTTSTTSHPTSSTDAPPSLDQSTSPPITLHQIAHSLPSSLKMYKGISDPSGTLGPKSTPAELVACFCSLLAAEDNPTSSGLLSLILRRISSSRDSSASYAVDYETVCRRLKGRVLDSVVRERWGDEAARVLGVVLKNGKMDEKHISKVAMLAPKDVRVITASLSSSSLLELQEVPRSADRAPSRTFYLWHVDLPRAYTALISHLYKTLANLGQRKAAEVEKKRALVERRERVDVRESGGELLGEVDRKEGKELDERLMKLTLAEMRTDMNVFILRDLPGGPVGSTQVDAFDK